MVENLDLEKLKDLCSPLDGAENSAYLRLICLSLFILRKIAASQSFPDNERKKNVCICRPVTLLLSILDGAAKTAPVERNTTFERAERDQPDGCCFIHEITYK